MTVDFDLFDSVAVIPEEPAPARPSENVAFDMKPDEEWGWEDLRNYVIAGIERYHGPQVRDNIKEKSIFGSFIKRHGAVDSAAIVRYAFGFNEGMWNNAPISVNRFCKASDSYFADAIKQRLA